MEGDVGPADRCRPGPPVGLQHVAVHRHLHFAEGHHVTHRPQRPPDEPLDLLGAPGLLSLGRLAGDPLAGRTREQRVLGGDPPLATAPHPRGDPLLDRGRAQHPGPTHRHQDRARGEDGEVPFERGRPELVVSCARRPGRSSGWRSDSIAHSANSFPIAACSTGPPNAASASAATVGSADGRPPVGDHQPARRRPPGLLPCLASTHVTGRPFVLDGIGGLAQHQVEPDPELGHRPARARCRQSTPGARSSPVDSHAPASRSCGRSGGTSTGAHRCGHRSPSVTRCQSTTGESARRARSARSAGA